MIPERLIKYYTAIYGSNDGFRGGKTFMQKKIFDELTNIDDLPQRYIINKGATILFWADGSKTIVKRCKDDKYNKRLGFLTAYFQKHCGMSKNKANKYLASLEEEE